MTVTEDAADLTDYSDYEEPGMSTGTKVVLGVLGAALLGGGGFLLYRKLNA